MCVLQKYEIWMKSQDGPIDVFLCPDDSSSSKCSQTDVDSKVYVPQYHAGACLSPHGADAGDVSSSQDVSFCAVTSSQPDSESLPRIAGEPQKLHVFNFYLK